ncbi:MULTISPECIES: ABC transporter substrate-binding protein [Arthrobacter]|uniref:ABC transporter substrate-binding protein n=1 Tax=Arthrobacter TaxID=1663 RepID=UPI00339144A2
MAKHRLTTLAAVVAAASLALTACGSSTPAANDGGPAAFGECQLYGDAGSISLTPVTPDTLTVQTNLPSPGWWKGISPEKITGGFEYCLAANIAHRAGLSKLKVVNASFDALVAGQTKDYDIAMAQISITAEREKVVQFSKPYFDSNVAILAKKGADVTAANMKDKKLGVALGTTAVEFVQKKINPSTPARVFQETDAMVTGVASGQIDAALQDTAIMLGFASGSSGALEVIGQYKTGEQYGAIYPKGSENAAAMDAAIESMSTDGTLEKLSADWLGPTLGGDPAKIPVFPTP